MAGRGRADSFVNWNGHMAPYLTKREAIGFIRNSFLDGWSGARARASDDSDRLFAK